LQEVEVAGGIEAQAAAVAGHAGDGRRRLLAALVLVAARGVDQLALLVVAAHVTVVAPPGREDAAPQVNVETAHAVAAPGPAVELAEGVLARLQRRRFQIACEAGDRSLVTSRAPGVDVAARPDGQIDGLDRRRPALACWAVKAPDAIEAV